MQVQGKQGFYQHMSPHEKHEKILKDAITCELKGKTDQAKIKYRKLITVGAFNKDEAMKRLNDIEQAELAEQTDKELEFAKAKQFLLDNPTYDIQILKHATQCESDGEMESAQTMYRELIMLGSVNKALAQERLNIIDKAAESTMRAELRKILPLKSEILYVQNNVRFDELFGEARGLEINGMMEEAKMRYELLIQQGAPNSEAAQCRLDTIAGIEAEPASIPGIMKGDGYIYGS